MKRKLSFLFLSALTVPFFMGSCSDDKEEQEVKPATDLVVDNNSVTLLQGDEITVSITSGNGDYMEIRAALNQLNVLIHTKTRNIII